MLPLSKFTCKEKLISEKRKAGVTWSYERAGDCRAILRTTEAPGANCSQGRAANALLQFCVPDNRRNNQGFDFAMLILQGKKGKRIL